MPTCAALVKKFPCSEYYAPGKIYAGWCDKTCGYGSCAGPSPSPPPGPSSGPKCPYLLTQNNASYMCSVDDVMAASNDTSKYSFGCSQQFYYGAARVLDRRAQADALKCPDGKTIKCFIHASYGNVAGSCGECQMNQKCGTCQDCTAKDKCGYSSYGCFGNCVDCFGETCDPPGSGNPGCSAYFPDSMGAACIGKQSCYVQVSGIGLSASWVSADGKISIPVSKQPGVESCHGVDQRGKLKVLTVCS